MPQIIPHEKQDQRMGLSLKARASPLASAAEQLRILSAPNGFPRFEERMRTAGLFPLAATGITVFQINVGKLDRKSTRLNSSHGYISYAVFCLKKKIVGERLVHGF